MEKIPKVISHTPTSSITNRFLMTGLLKNNSKVIRYFNQSKHFKLSTHLLIMACIMSAVCSCASNSAQAQLKTYGNYGSNANKQSSIQNSGTPAKRYNYSGSNSYSRSYGNGFQTSSNDKIRTLIQTKSNDSYESTSQAFYKTQANEYHNGHSHSNDEWSLPRGFSSANLYSTDYYDWIEDSWNQQSVNQYQQFLSQYLGKNNLPPMSQLLLTARTWRKCGAPVYEVPPNYLWDNMIPTLQLYTNLKNQGVIPKHTVIRSVYRNPSLNRCAGGANGSKHKMNAAMDLWLPEFEYDVGYKEKIREQLCQFWLYNGENYNMGLGIYRTGAIHIDTQGYRKWGGQNTASYSSCRY